MKSSAKNTLCLLLLGVVFALIIAANYMVFLVVPNERMMGPVQRIFYFHVGSAVACYCSFAVVLISSFAYLANRSWKMDALMEASGEVGFVLCTIVLASGMIWGHAAWNTWFSWEPRLVTFLLIWLLFLGFNLLRSFGDPVKIGVHSAVLGILGAFTVPIMVYSIKLLPAAQQLHPEVVGKGGLSPVMKQTFFFTMGTVVLLQFLLIWVRARIGFLQYGRR